MNTLFEDFTDLYESMVDWPKRLARETSFYQQLFAELQATSVLDAACGTGHHAAMFHGWGLRVEGADISRAMIDRARRRHAQPDGLTWTVRGFAEPVAGDRPFDVALCVGNSLALATDYQMVQSAIEQLIRAVADRGAVVVHVLNLWRLADGPTTWQKCFKTIWQGESVLVHKGVRRHGADGQVELLVTRAWDSQPTVRSESTRLLGLEADQLSASARRAGAREVQLWGGYAGEPYLRESSVDLVLVARR